MLPFPCHWLPVAMLLSTAAAGLCSVAPPETCAIPPVRLQITPSRCAGSLCAGPPARNILLRGGGLEDQVTPTEIMEIGNDVLKMWEVSHKETVESAAAGAASNCSSEHAAAGGLSEEKARTLISDELHPKPQPTAAAGSAAEGPEQEQRGEGLSAQGGPSSAPVAGPWLGQLRCACDHRFDDMQYIDVSLYVCACVCAAVACPYACESVRARACACMHVRYAQ
jgi:hypothetical protein